MISLVVTEPSACWAESWSLGQRKIFMLKAPIAQIDHFVSSSRRTLETRLATVSEPDDCSDTESSDQNVFSSQSISQSEESCSVIAHDVILVPPNKQKNGLRTILSGFIGAAVDVNSYIFAKK